MQRNQGDRREMLVRAGERAASLGCERRGPARYERAMSSTDDSIVQAELHKRAGIKADLGARAEEANASLRASDRALRGGRGQPPGCEGVGPARRDHVGAGAHGRGHREHGRSFQVRSRGGARRGPCDTRRPLGRFMFFAGDVEVAGRRIETALDLAEALSSRKSSRRLSTRRA